MMKRWKKKEHVLRRWLSSWYVLLTTRKASVVKMAVGYRDFLRAACSLAKHRCASRSISILEYPREHAMLSLLCLRGNNKIQKQWLLFFRDPAIRLFTVKLLGLLGNHCDSRRYCWIIALCKMLRRKWSTMQMHAFPIFLVSFPGFGRRLEKLYRDRIVVLYVDDMISTSRPRIFIHLCIYGKFDDAKVHMTCKNIENIQRIVLFTMLGRLSNFLLKYYFFFF